jgi:thiamine biosynthesis protein ThiS
MNIYLNGEVREVPENLTLSALLEWLKFPADRVAVERNREIAARSTWDKIIIQPDDRLEVVHFVGGGAGESGDRSQETVARSQELGDRSKDSGVRRQASIARN